jgi:hypothetical protein
LKLTTSVVVAMVSVASLLPPAVFAGADGLHAATADAAARAATAMRGRRARI